MSLHKSRHPELINKALNIAIDAHRGQYDKGGYEYILHPIAVADKCFDDYEKIVALLHDVVEDTDVTLEQLASEGFPDSVMEALECLTKRNGEKYLEEYIPRVLTNPIARQVKIRDIEHNTSMRRMMQVEPKFAEKLVRRYRDALFMLVYHD